jgi:ABC-type branched-subunit amino acid transport system substrate-binding protein
MSNATDAAGILSSLRYYDALRASSSNVSRPEGSNVDILANSQGQELAYCHLSGLLRFTKGDYVPVQATHEDAAAIALAIQHLNTGDGSIVPAIEGLNESCNVRFTVEFGDTQYNPGVGLSIVANQTRRELPEQKPCAFLGAYRSAVSITTSIATGILGYPQVSGGSTSTDLDDKSQFPLFGRTIPSDAGIAIPLIKYLRNVLQIRHLAIINANDAYGNAYVDGMRAAALEFAPDMTLSQIPLDDTENGITVAIQTLKATEFRFVYGIIYTDETHDALMREAYREGVAGDGLHNWIFGDSFVGTLDGRSFAADSPLHYAYK